MLSRRLVWVFVFCASLIPFILLLRDAITENLGANPIETLHLSLGDWALRFLCFTLALTPLKILTGQRWPVRFRRMLGLFSFFYASLHLMVYLVLDLSFSWEQFVDEIPKSPYILVGLFTYSLLLILAVTSPKVMKKKCGRHWKKIHQLIYLAAISTLVHFFWLVKLEMTEPLIYSVFIGCMLMIRLVFITK
ncbi:MAG: sulfoxide reductase heme-binding subunit YedZ [Methylococcaceae bacterium]|nr:sulfoxide reductase heme-binding subunit YedZ [Methylococcaceae bacterium]